MTERQKAILAGAVFLAILAAPIALVARMLWPDGDLVAELDVRDGAAVHELDAEPGDVLHLRLTVSAAATNRLGDPGRSSERAIRDALRASIIAIRAEGPDGAADGAADEATCGAYADRSTSVEATPGRLRLGGVPLTCRVALSRAGRRVVRASARWAAGLDVHAATLELRRERP